MTTENEIEAVVAEVICAARLGSKGPDMKSTAEAAARLILEARQERDEALAHAGYEEWKAEFDALRAERDEARARAAVDADEASRSGYEAAKNEMWYPMQQLQVEIKNLTAERDEARREAKTLWEDRDEVMQTVTALRAERDEAWDRIRELDVECAHWHAERDAAARTLDEAKDAFARHVDELQARVREIEQLTAPDALDAFTEGTLRAGEKMRARIATLEAELTITRGAMIDFQQQRDDARAEAADCHAKWLDEAEKRRKLLETEAELRESIQTWQQTAHEVGEKYEALARRGAENARLRTAFEDADWTFCTCEACQHNEGVLGDLAAALEGDK